MKPGFARTACGVQPLSQPAEETAAPPAGAVSWASLLLCFLLAFGLYNANLRVIASGDSRSTRYVPFALLERASLNLAPYREQVLMGRAKAYWLRELAPDRAYSTYPLVTPVVAMPLYVPVAVWLAANQWEPRRLGVAALWMEKLAASALAAAGVALLHLLLCRLLPRGPAALLTLAYAAGTGTWAVSSQALWQHALAQTLLVLALLLSTLPATPRRPLVAGVVVGLLAANRLPDLPLALGLAIWWAVGGRRRATLHTLGLALGALPFLVTNILLFGNPVGGYAAFAHTPASFGSFQGVTAPLAMLLSPGKGLLFFSPFLLLLAWRARGDDPLPRGLSHCLWFAFVAQLLLYSFVDWDGGACYGPRFLLDVVPFLIVQLVPVVTRARRPPLALAGALLALSITVQYVGALYYRGTSDAALRVRRQGPVAHDPVWRLALTPIWIEARQPRAPSNLLDSTAAADRVEE